MSNIKKFIKLLLIPMTIIAFASTAFAESFSDIKIGDPYYVAITYLKDAGIIEGYSDKTFKANQKINRAEALKMLTITSGVFNEENIEETEEQPFNDTPSNAWFTKYIAAAKEKGIINGYNDGSFKPDVNINLAETLKIFFESVGPLYYGNTAEYLFDDTKLGDWFTKYTAYAGSYGIINIYPSNTINPNQEMTRGYLAEIIYRKKMSRDGYRFGKATWYGAAAQGNGTASGEVFDMNKRTAAHKTLAFGTIVEVTNLANGKSVQVKITDRGPYGPGRVLDLSSSAFSEIASLGSGIINAQYKIIENP